MLSLLDKRAGLYKTVSDQGQNISKYFRNLISGRFRQGYASGNAIPVFGAEQSGIAPIGEFPAPGADSAITCHQIKVDSKYLK